LDQREAKYQELDRVLINSIKRKKTRKQTKKQTERKSE